MYRPLAESGDLTSFPSYGLSNEARRKCTGLERSMQSACKVTHFSLLFIYGQHFRLLVVGGGAAGMGASHKFARKLPKFSVAVVEPNENHYYQPGFTMVGGGWMTVEQNTRREKDLIHPNSVWLHDRVAKFEPKKNMVKLGNGDEITYDYMILATGVQLRWDMIKGLPEAFDTPGVTSNYTPLLCPKTNKELNTVTSGNCVFTFPNTPIKCAGAPQKVLYYGEEIVRNRGYRDKTNFIYATSLPRYSLLHIAPPCSTPPAVRECRELTDEKGWVDVDPKTLRYDGYCSCPLVIGKHRAILAEFNADGQRMETTPLDQSKARRHPWFMKRYLMPFLYWGFLVKGRWNGPAFIRSSCIWDLCQSPSDFKISYSELCIDKKFIYCIL
ncbi:pyridine nucleotide-disulfide oxidoreductase [Teladorsagia circumcincta]|uniref:Pyridine nucleotide-disulfide oxidoreductase n=1 Tax=Teladorsagia circumcincta TaxID=45464 RepID=A0A2G9UWM1_TELCI|nr:pyridine nucleotide-disulfide oxidoreductase [Teladorsagia circumcincta]